MMVDVQFSKTRPDLKLDQAYRMRNALAHGYYSVNLITVWNTVQNDLQILKRQMIELQNALGGPGSD